SVSWRGNILQSREYHEERQGRPLDLWSWTCHRSKAKTGGKAIGWTSWCIQQKYTFSASIAVLVLEIFSVWVFIGLQRGFSVARKSSIGSFGKWKGYATLNRRR
ncbi:hypothetical protein CLAIMM_12752 isoform 2, partial [Cladophialophora immunda]